MNTFRMKPLAAALLVATAISAPPMYAYAASAAKPADPAVAASTKAGPDASELLKLSQDGNVALRDIRGARIAIFNGDPKMARDLTGAAKTALEAATKEAPTLIVNTMTGVDGKIVHDNTDVSKLNMIPIDGEVSLADSFVPTPEKKTHIAKANEHFKAGRSKQAIEELRLADVDANYTRVLMPLDATKTRVADASRLLAGDKYYEANLALKAAEDGVVVDTVSLLETPAKAAAKKPADTKSKAKS
ncbi:MAG: YfdX family protein [Burkholderiales bacterium]|nr:YfdX family protein [Burkholderiales bacterium]